MRLVVDTNIFISAALKQSSWPAAVVRWVDRQGGVLKTAETEREVFDVLGRSRFAAKISPAFVDRIRRLFADAELVAIVEPVRVCRDPKDDKFLELAVNGDAQAIVSGDADLLVLGRFRGMPILDPAAFARLTAKLTRVP